MAFSSTDLLLKIGENKHTTADAVSSEVSLTEYCFLQQAPKVFMHMVYQKAAMKCRRDIIECAVTFGLDLPDALHDRKPFFTGFRLRGCTVLENLAEDGNLDMVKYLDEKCHFFAGRAPRIDLYKITKAGSCIF